MRHLINFMVCTADSNNKKTSLLAEVFGNSKPKTEIDWPESLAPLKHKNTNSAKTNNTIRVKLMS